jgi:hypothetical protein
LWFSVALAKDQATYIAWPQITSWFSGKNPVEPTADFTHGLTDDDRAGVSGLTTAYLLSKDPSNKITVLAKHMPGDYDIEYASPWAGANYMPYVIRS